MVKNHKAWDTLIWLGGLLTIATSLKESGFIFWFSGILENRLIDFSPILITLSLALIYFYSMYLFSTKVKLISANFDRFALYKLNPIER